MPFFGFVPSEALLKNIQMGIEKKNSNESLYPLRDKTALLINDEIIDAILTNVVHHFPVSDKRDTAEKLAGYIKSTVAVLLKQLLSKSSNDVVRQSIEFSERSLFQDKTGQYYVGEQIDQNLAINIKACFNDILLDKAINRSILVDCYKQFADATVQHFMVEFNQTLGLGMIKSKVADLGATAVTKAVHLAINKLIPHLTHDELKALAEYHDGLFFIE